MKTTQYKIAIETTFSEEEIQISIGDYDLIGYEITESPNGWIDLFLKSESLIDLTNYLKAHHYEDLIDEITKEEIDWEKKITTLEGEVNHFRTITQDLFEETNDYRKRINNLEKELREAQTQVIKTEFYEINLNFYRDHHSWEYADGTEGGELIIKNKELIDYDGTYQLGSQILIALHQNGINVLKMR
jgi:hypothetical protein